MIITAAKVKEAEEVLGVDSKELTPKGLDRAYRIKAKTCHPDHHGTSKLETWAKVSWAKECLARWLQTRPVQEEATSIAINACRTCKGEGRVPVKRAGFGEPLSMICIVCKGEGELLTSENSDPSWSD